MSNSPTAPSGGVRLRGSEYVASLPSRDFPDIPSAREKCPICHEAYAANPGSRIVQATCCRWHFHSDCLMAWVGEEGTNKSSCPCCRRELFQQNLNPRGYRYNWRDTKNPAYWTNRHGTLDPPYWSNASGNRVEPLEVSDYLLSLKGEAYPWGPLTYYYQDGKWLDPNGDTVGDNDVSMYLNDEVEVDPEDMLATPDEINPHGFRFDHGEWVNGNNERVSAREVSQWTDQPRLVIQCSYKDGEWQYPGRGAPFFVLRPGAIPDQMVSWLLNGVLQPVPGFVLENLQFENAEENAEEDDLETPD